MRKFEARFTDAAVGSLSEPLQGVLSQRIGHRLPASIQSGPLQESSSPVHQLVLDNLNAESGVIETVGVVKAAPAEPVVAQTGTDLARLREIFRFDEDRIRLDLTQLKGSSRMDDVRRLTYLHLYASELLGMKLVSKNSVIEAIKEAGWYDTNSTKVFNNLNDLAIEGDQVRLRITGRQRAQDYLNEILDPKITPTTTRPVSNRGKARNGAIAEGESDRRTGRSKGGEKSDKVKAWVAAWKGSGQPFDGHSLLANRSLADRGLVALWAIRKATNDDVKEVSARFLSQFLHAAFEHMADPRNIDRALKKQRGKTVLNTTGTQFQINGTGMGYVEDLIKASGVKGANDEASA